MTGEEKEEKLKDLMNRISLVLEDDTLQQGFEIICKKLAELEKENGKLQGKIADLESEYYELENFKDNEITELKAQLTILEKRINTLKIKNASLERKNEEQKAQTEKMKCCGNCKYNNRPLVYDKEDGCYRKLYCKDCYLRNKWETAE